jgi:hypothetical protein
MYMNTAHVIFYMLPFNGPFCSRDIAAISASTSSFAIRDEASSFLTSLFVNKHEFLLLLQKRGQEVLRH